VSGVLLPVFRLLATSLKPRMFTRKVKERQKEKLPFHKWRTVYHIRRTAVNRRAT
jgi:hypothetical protein